MREAQVTDNSEVDSDILIIHSTPAADGACTLAALWHKYSIIHSD